MKINDIHHLAINTMEIEKSIAFYTEILKFKLTEKVDMGDCVLVYLKIRENTYIELFDLKGKCREGNLAEEQQGMKHIAFEVEDIKAWNTYLISCGVSFILPLTELEPINKNVILIEDPDKVVIELCETMKKD